MTPPIQEPSSARDTSGLNWSSRQLARRPANGAGQKNPWIALFAGGTTAATDTWMPVPFPEVAYDPALVVLGDIFDLTTTDTGDPGNTRYNIITIPKGVYYAELWSEWGNIITDGSNNFGYAVQDMFYNAAPNSLLSGNEFSRASADWPKNAATSDFEMESNPFLFTAHELFMNETSWNWDPWAKQTTGIDRALSGVRLYLEARLYSDVSTWTFDSV